MPARLHFSNSLDALADRLVENWRGPDPFASPCIATPSPALRNWLQIRIAEHAGIAVNLGFQTLEKLLWQLLSERDRFRDDPLRQPARLLDAANLQGLLMSALGNSPPDLIREYLHPETSEPHDAARRLCQLSGRLAALFREYEYSRVGENGFRGLTDAWKRGESCFEPYLRGRNIPESKREQVRELEQWQMEIYRVLFCEGGMRDRWGEASQIYRYTLPQYAGMVLGQDRGASSGNPSPPVHLFGLSHISPFHRALVRRLADESALGAEALHFEIYALSPCAEYWEDALTPKELRARRQRSAKYHGWHAIHGEERLRARLSEEQLQAEDLPEEDQENALLSRFGKPGRETVQLWNQVTDYDFCGHFREPQGDVLLSVLQRALLHRSGPLPDAERRPQDASLQIRSAPDIYAEAEATRAHIAERLLADPELRLEDIAIIAADFDAYLPVLESVFAGQEKHRAGFVPHCFLDGGARESAVLRGFRLLLELTSGPFRPAALIAFLENPAVCAKLRLDGNTILRYGKFLERAGFQEGWDADHLRQQDIAPGSRSTWEAAQQRVLLGLAMDASDPALAESEWAPVAEASTGLDREELAGLLELLEGLRQDARFFHSGESLSFPVWGAHLREYLARYFRADPDDPLECQGEAELRRFCADLESWNGWEDAGNAAGHASHHVISVLFQDHFSKAAGLSRRTPFLQGGVRIGGFATLRSLPFRHVYVLGLNAGDFPAAREASPLDLRGFRRILGEADPTARDLYGFLEMLSTVSESLLLSYVRRDSLRDSIRQPSYALSGLTSYLETDVLPQGKSFQILKLDEEGRYVPAPEEICEPSPRRQWEPLRLEAAPFLKQPWMQPPALPRGIALAEENPALDFRDVSDYLKNPAAHACFNRFRLASSLGEEEEDDAPALAHGKYAQRDFLVEILGAELSAPGSGMEALEKALRAEALSGQGLPPPFSHLAAEDLEKAGADLIANKIAALRETLKTLGLGFAGTLRIGTAAKPLQAPILALPIFDAMPLGISARIGGALPLFLVGKNSGAWGLLLSQDADWANLPVYLFQLCAAALETPRQWGTGFVFICQLQSGSSAEPWRGYRLPDMSAQSAAADLRSVVEDVLRSPDFEALPLRVVEQIAKKHKDVDAENISEWKEKLEERERESLESNFQNPSSKTRMLRAIAAQTPADADAKIRRRLLPFLRWRKQWTSLDASEETPP